MRSYAWGALILLGFVDAAAHAPTCSTSTTAPASPTSTACSTASATPIFQIYAKNDAGAPFLPAIANIELLIAYDEVSVEYGLGLANNTIPSNAVWSLDPQTGYLDVVSGPGSTPGQRLFYAQASGNITFPLTIKPGDTPTLYRQPINTTSFDRAIDPVSSKIDCRWENVTGSAQFGACQQYGGIRVAAPDYSFLDNQCYPVTLYAKLLATTSTVSSAVPSPTIASTNTTFMIYAGNDEQAGDLPDTFSFELKPGATGYSGSVVYYPGVAANLTASQDTIWSLDPNTGHITVVSSSGNSTGQVLTCTGGYISTVNPADIASFGAPCSCKIEAYSGMLLCQDQGPGQFAICNGCNDCGLVLKLTPEGTFLPDYDCDPVSVYAKIMPDNSTDLSPAPSISAVCSAGEYSSVTASGIAPTMTA